MTTRPSALGTLPAVYGKAVGVHMPSGFLAIEAALRIVGVRRGDSVVVPRTSCWKIPGAVCRIGAQPALCEVDSCFVACPASMAETASRAGACAIIAIHQYGFPLDTCAIRRALPAGVAIIEDAAQAWGIDPRCHSIGAHSEVVVTSFGPGKPLTFGSGGAAFFDSHEACRLFDLTMHRQPGLAEAPIPYKSPPPSEEAISTGLIEAASRLKARRKFVTSLTRLLDRGSRCKLCWSGSVDGPSWHRAPVIGEHQDSIEALALELERLHIPFQRPFEHEHWEIPHLGCTEDAHTQLRPQPPHLLVQPGVATKRALSDQI